MGTKYAKTELSNGKSIQVKLLPAISKGLPVARRLLDVVAPAIGGTLDGLKHDELLHGVPKTFTELSLVVCQQLEKAEIGSLSYTLLEGLQVDNEEVDLDDYFTANYNEFVEILEFSLKENFKSFFTGNGMKQRFQKVVGMIASGHTEDQSQQS